MPGTPALLIAGTSSWAGKSLITTAVCAALRRRGVAVVPFKAQNMSNNARVADGGEIGAAQYFQALACGVVPSVRHNPVLLKPEAHTRSQVVVRGQVSRPLTETPWRDRAELVWPVIRESYDELAGSAELVVIEGAGSPAEINLASTDLANLRIARHADSRMLLVTDIDRGGAFAHLYGTWSLLEPADRARIAGFVLNKFRGDPALLDPGPAQLERLTGVPTLGVVPMTDHGLPDEDGADPGPGSGTGRRIRILRGPAASNLDEWQPLREAADCRWATAPGHLADAELIIAPGSKLVTADLAWARRQGMDRALTQAHRRGVPILAVCGGLQLLGEEVADPHGSEGPPGARYPGLGLVPAVTTLGEAKTVRRSRHRFRPDLPAPWAALSGLEAEGYEVHYGITTSRLPARTATVSTGTVPAGAIPTGTVPACIDGSGLVAGTVLGGYLHGLCENPLVLEALAGARPRRTLDQVLDGLADLAERHLDLDTILGSAGRHVMTAR